MSKLTLSTGTSKLDVSDVPTGWVGKQLRDFCAFSQGGRLGLTKQDHYRAYGVPAFSAAGQDGYVDMVEFRSVDAVVLSAIGANCGRCFLAVGDWTTLANVQVIIPNATTALARFLYYRVNRDDYWPRSGSAQPFIKPSDVKACWVGLPPPVEQAVVADILGDLDVALQETEAIIAKLKSIKQGLLHDLLTRGIDANGELRPPRSEAPHLYKETPLGWIPKDWDEVTLGTVSHNVTSGSRDWARFYADSGALFVRIANLTREHINLRYDSTIFVQPPKNGDGQRTRLEEGDILISITADLGIIGVVPEGVGEAYINQHIAMVRADRAVMNPRFIGHYLADANAQKYIAKLNDAGAKAGLNLPTIRSLLTVRPRREEQDVIAARLDAVDKRILSAALELRKLRDTKIGVMDDLLTGRVRVTPLLEQTTETPS